MTPEKQHGHRGYQSVALHRRRRSRGCWFWCRCDLVTYLTLLSLICLLPMTVAGVVQTVGASDVLGEVADVPFRCLTRSLDAQYRWRRCPYGYRYWEGGGSIFRTSVIRSISDQDVHDTGPAERPGAGGTGAWGLRCRFRRGRWGDWSEEASSVLQTGRQ